MSKAQVYKLALVAVVALLLLALLVPAALPQPRDCVAQADALRRTLCLLAKSRAADPPNHPQPDLIIGDREVLFAVQIWIKGEGEVVVDDEAVLAAVALWVRGAPWTDPL